MGLISINTTHSIKSTIVSNNFIDGYFGRANPAFIVVYLYFYRHFQSQNANLDIKEVADRLGLLESDVVNALKYWRNSQLITFEINGDNYTIDFLDLQSANLPTQPVQSKSNILRVVKKDELKLKRAKTEKIAEIKKSAILERRPTYKPGEIEIYQKESSEIKRLFVACEKSLGRLLSSNDLSAIFSFYDWLRLPIDVIIRLIDHCSEINKTNIRYIESAAISWHEKEISTVESANELIASWNANYHQILKALGLGGKEPAPAQLKFMNKWIDEYKMPLDVILEACDLTIIEAPKPGFKYADSIVKKWHELNIKTVDAAKKEVEEFRKNNVQSKTKAKPGKFVNFSQREWNFKGDDLQNLKWKYLEDGSGD